MVATNDMHDPRRPEVPKADRLNLMMHASQVLWRAKADGLDAVDVLTDLLVSTYESGAIAGMKAQYEHDREAGGPPTLTASH